MPFSKNTPILYYDPRPTASWSRRQYFLYPVRMYRIVAPRISSRKLNILEKAVLGMCRVGVTEVAEIGRHLDIGKDLAALIVSQLSDRGYVNSQGLLTDRGLKTLEDEIFIEHDATAGFVFQDPWTGDLFPRFVEREEYADVRYNDSGFPELILGTTGKPNYQRAFLPCDIRNTIERQPLPSEILNVVRQHSRTIKNVNRIKDDEEAWIFQQIPDLDRINFIDEKPTDLWLVTCIYIPAKVESANVWNICDPFGLGDSPWLLRKLEKHRRDGTIQGLEKFLLDMVGEQRREEFVNLDDWLTLADREASLQVEYKLTPAIKQWKELFEDLVAIERSYIEAKDLTEPKILLDKLKDILVKSQIAAERLFKVLQKEYPAKNCWNRLSERTEHNRETLNRFAQNAGFTEPLPETLLSVERNTIRKTAIYGNGSLRALMLAALLATPDYAAHPLKCIAQECPDLLNLLDRLAQMRNSYAGHATNQYATAQPLELVDVRQQIDTVYKLVAGTLHLSYQLST